MKRIWMGSLGLLLLAGASDAQTFRATSLVSDQNVPVFTQSESRRDFDRNLLSEPWATVVLGRVDIYDRFPYLEARYFQVVSDPGWNRLVFGETDQGLQAFDGEGSAFGALKQPRGMAVDEFGHLYVADSGNDRVLVFGTDSEFSQLELHPLYAVEGLARPHDVAFSDGGTPFDATDDRLYVAETGANAVARIDLGDDTARVVDRLGHLGGGENRFAGPMAIAVGRSDGHNTDTVYVADAHSGRLVRLTDSGTGLQWRDALDDTGSGIRDLDTDQFGQIYAVSPASGSIQKFNRELLPVAELSSGLHAPRSIHIPQVTVHDHVRDLVERDGSGSAMVMDEWSPDSGLHLYELGVEITQPNLVDESQAEFGLSDRARVSATLVSSSGQQIATRDLGWLEAGPHRFDATALSAGRPAGDYRLELRAVSAQDSGRDAVADLAMRTDGTGSPQVRDATVLGASPNPFNPSTHIEFVVPSGASLFYRVEILDLRGRTVRQLEEGTAEPGLHRVTWNGRDEDDRSVASGVYLYRVQLGDQVHHGKLALVK